VRHLYTWQPAGNGHKDVTEVLLEAGALLSTVDDQVIKPSVKLRKSNIKPSSDE
jgi:hypothetical protein